jgi:hypothetical protein
MGAGAHQARTPTRGRCGSRRRTRHRSPRPISPANPWPTARARAAAAPVGGRSRRRESHRRYRGACAAARASLES